MRPCYCALLVAFAVSVLSQVSVFAQKPQLPELVTDRPDFTESSEVVGTGILQLEFGTSVEGDGQADARDRVLTAPLALLRVGVARRVELRFSSDGYIFDRLGSRLGQTTTRGEADLEVGAKVVLKDGASGFGMAVIPMMSLPTGADSVSSGTIDPTVKFTWATALPKDFDLSGNVNVSRFGDELGRYTEQAVSVSLGHGLAAGWGGYWEAYGFMPQGETRASAWTVDTGLTHGIGGNAQLDLEIGRGVTAAAPDWFVGVGFGIRTAALRPRHR